MRSTIVPVTLTAVALTGLAITAATTVAADRRAAKPQLVDGKGVVWWARRARANGDAMRWQKKRAAKLERQLRRSPHVASAQEAIAYVFGPYASQALTVAWCESRYSIWAANGQYLGLFQMGDFARARYGHGANAWAQAVSAYRYFADSGFDWSPWACKP